MHAYVTGVTGCVGRNIVEKLLEAGWEVTCLHRKSSVTATLADCKVSLKEVDFYDKESLMQAIPSEVDALFHVAGNVAYWPDKNLWKDNVLITRNLVEVSLAKRVKKFIFTSTGATLPHQATSKLETLEKIESGYVRTKRLAELEIFKGISKGLFAVILQPIIVIGKYDYHGHYSRIFREKDLSSALPGSLEFCHAEDIAKAHISAFHHGRCAEHYVLGGDFLSWFEFFTLVAEATGAKPPKRVLPTWLLTIVSHIQLLLFRTFGTHPEITPELVSLLKGGEGVPFNERLKSEKELGYHSQGVQRAIRDCHEWITKPNALPIITLPVLTEQQLTTEKSHN